MKRGADSSRGEVLQFLEERRQREKWQRWNALNSCGASPLEEVRLHLRYCSHLNQCRGRRGEKKGAAKDLQKNLVKMTRRT